MLTWHIQILLIIYQCVVCSDVCIITQCPLPSNSINPVVDHHQPMVLPGLSHPTQLPPSVGGKRKTEVLSMTRIQSIIKMQKIAR